jgi:hypothetical protein
MLSNNATIEGTMQIGNGSTYGTLLLDVRGGIKSVEYLLTSDIRVKENIEFIDNIRCRNAIKDIELISYNLTHDNSKKIRYGFVAQEIEKIDKNLVQNIADFIPNIMKYFDFTENYFILNQTDIKYDIKLDDYLKIYVNEKQDIVKVIGINCNKVFVDRTDLYNKKVFIYGKQIDDFKTIDYAQMFALSIGTIKNLIDEVDRLKSIVYNK